MDMDMDMDIARVPIPVDTSAPSGRTNAYVVGVTDALLVDPAARDDALTREIERRDVSHVVVTHTHSDHVGAVAHYADVCDAVVWTHDGYASRFERATGIPPTRTFCAGDVVGPATVVSTPGHAPDHVAFAVEDALLVGDVAVAEGSVFVGGDDGDMRIYFETLERLATRPESVFYPGHGPPITTPRQTVRRLLEHRRDREARVLDAVRDGAQTPAEIVEVAYDIDLDGVRDLARLAVEAHLDKLAAEGTVRWDGIRASPQ